MITGYKVLANGYYGGSDVFPGPDLPARYRFVAPPSLQVGEYAKWHGGGWVVTTTPPPPIVAGPPLLNYSVTLKDFWRRFLVAEREALQNILATGTQNQKNKLNAFRDYLLQGGNVELNDDYVIASVNLMETAGIIGSGRATQILTP